MIRQAELKSSWSARDANTPHPRSIRQLAKRMGVCPQVVYRRLHQGDTLEQAIERVELAQENKRIRALAKANGVRPDAAVERVRRGGWSIERATSEPTRPSRNPTGINRRKRDSEEVSNVLRVWR